MNLDDRTLSLLALQLIVLTALGGAILFARTSASTRAWSIRLTILLGIALVCISQLPVTRSLPDNRPIMLPPQMMAVSAINQKLQNIEVQTTLPSERGATISISVAQVWGAGIVLGLIWCAFAAIKIRRLKKRSSHFTTVQGLEVRVATRIGSPLVAGLFRQNIYLPEGLAEKLSEDELQLVFAHEIAHVEHRDLLWKMMHRLTCIFFWPNIAVGVGAVSRSCDGRTRGCTRFAGFQFA